MNALADRAAKRRLDRQTIVENNRATRRFTHSSERNAALAYFASLPTKKLVKLRYAAEVALAGKALVRGEKRTSGWSDSEILMLSVPLPAAVLVTQMPGKTTWSINRKRRQLGISCPRGPRVLLPEDFPGTDWNQSINKLSRELEVSFVTAKRLKLLATALSTDSLQSG